MRNINRVDNNNLVTLIRACYGRYNSFRITSLGIQEITNLYQFVSRGISKYRFFFD